MTKTKIIQVGGEGGFGGLYNVLFGDGHEIDRVNMLVATTGLEYAQLGRPRDMWVEQDDEHGGRFALYTRNGGGNRPDYAEQIAAMQASPYYLSDEDDEFDSTYATFRFRVPERLPDDAPAEVQEKWVSMRDAMIEHAIEPPNMSELWKAAGEKMNDPEYAKAVLDKSGLGEQLDAAFADLAPEEGTP